MALSTRVEAVPARAITPIHVAPRPVAPVHPPHSVAPDVRVLVALPQHQQGVSQLEGLVYDSLPLLPEEDVKDIKVQLRNRGWFSSRHCLVFGDKQLADAVRTSALVKGSGVTHPSILHVFVKLSDVDQVNVRTLKREFSLCSRAASAASTAGAASTPAPTPCPVSELALALSSASSSADGSSRSSANAVVHLMVHKSARVNWHHLNEDKFELSISTSDTVDSLMQKLEAANGGPLEADRKSVV